MELLFNKYICVHGLITYERRIDEFLSTSTFMWLEQLEIMN
jgi:hypothetical protein